MATVTAADASPPTPEPGSDTVGEFDVPVVQVVPPDQHLALRLPAVGRDGQLHTTALGTGFTGPPEVRASGFRVER